VCHVSQSLLLLLLWTVVLLLRGRAIHDACSVFLRLSMGRAFCCCVAACPSDLPALAHISSAPPVICPLIMPAYWPHGIAIRALTPMHHLQSCAKTQWQPVWQPWFI